MDKYDVLILIGVIAAMLMFGTIGYKVHTADCSFYANWAYRDIPARCVEYWGITGSN